MDGRRAAATSVFVREVSDEAVGEAVDDGDDANGGGRRLHGPPLSEDVEVIGLRKANE